MKIKYLGTAAAEGFPAVFCNCDACNTARAAGGLNIRMRSQMLIDDGLLIDFPADTYANSLLRGVRLDAVEYLLVTHSHGDHFQPGDLELRGICYAHRIRSPKLTILSNTAVFRKGTAFASDFHPDVRNGIDWVIAEAYKEYTLGEYRIVPLPANHMTSEQALIYIISRDGKTMLYGNDTGFLDESVFDFISSSGIKFDLLSLDCTMAENPVADSGTHMGFDGCARTVRRLSEKCALKKGCKAFVTHFSHNGNPLHERMRELGLKYGLETAYDGLELII